MKQPERRRHERLDANLFTEFEDALSKNKLGRGVVVDVSVSGFALETEVELEPGTELRCHIEIPLTVRAIVVRCIKEGQVKRYGIRFKGQSLFDKFLLKKMLTTTRHTKKV